MANRSQGEEARANLLMEDGLEAVLFLVLTRPGRGGGGGEGGRGGG